MPWAHGETVDACVKDASRVMDFAAVRVISLLTPMFDIMAYRHKVDITYRTYIVVNS